MHLGAIVDHIRAVMRHTQRDVGGAGERRVRAQQARAPVPESLVAALVRDSPRVLVVSDLPLEERIWAWLQARPSLTEGVWIICPESSDAGAVMLLVEAGFYVSCAREIDTAMLILNSRVGFTLPDYRPIRDPGETAAHWRLSQIGLYTRLSGTIGEHIPALHLFRLRERPDIWFSVAQDRAIPPPGMAVIVLAHWTPWTWAGDHLHLIACSIECDRPGMDRYGGIPVDGA